MATSLYFPQHPSDHSAMKLVITKERVRRIRLWEDVPEDYWIQGILNKEIKRIINFSNNMMTAPSGYEQRVIHATL